MANARELFKQRCENAVKQEVMDIPELGIKVLVRGFTLLGRSELSLLINNKTDQKPDPAKDQNEKEKEQTVSEAMQNARVQAAALIACCFDPETEKPIFDMTDIEWLVKAPPGIVDAINEKVNELSGRISKKPAEDAAKNSEKTQDSAMSSN